MPSKSHHRPTAYKGHFKIDLSEHGDLLTDEEHGPFPELPKESYESLGEDFKTTRIAQSPPGASTATILGKRGATPAEIILMKKNDAPPLKRFPATTFSLENSTSKQATRLIDNRETASARKRLNSAT